MKLPYLASSCEVVETIPEVTTQREDSVSLSSDLEDFAL